MTDLERMRKIVWGWIVVSNNTGNTDVDDLIFDLNQAGFPPPDDLDDA